MSPSAERGSPSPSCSHSLLWGPASDSALPPPHTVHSKILPKLSHAQSNCSANANQVSINCLEFQQCGLYTAQSDI